jgi:hypothetical protein
MSSLNKGRHFETSTKEAVLVNTSGDPRPFSSSLKAARAPAVNTIIELDMIVFKEN